MTSTQPSPNARPEMTAGSRGGLFISGIDPARLDTDGRVVLLALIISLVCHVAIFAAVHHRPLGGIDPALMTPAQEIIHIQRAVSQDAVTDSASNGPPIIEAGPKRQTTQPPPEAEAVRQTLADSTPVAPSTPPQPSPLLATPVTGPRVIQAGPNDPGRAGGLRDASQLGGSGDPNAPPGQAAGRGGDSGPRVDLPLAMSQPPTINQGVELNYSGPVGANSHLSVNGGALVPGAGHGKSVDGTGSGGSGMARDALTDQSIVPGISLGPPPLEASRPDHATGGPAPSTRTELTTPLSRVDIQPPTAIPPSQLEPAEHLDEDFDYVLTTIDSTPKSQGFLQVQFTPKHSLHRLKTMPKDVVFLLDTSLSIPQDWAQAAAQGVRDSLASLNEGDRFNVVLFNQAMQEFHPDGVVPATNANIAAASDFLDHVHAGGLTDINKAVSRLLVRDVGTERVYDIIFMSDGQPTEGVKDMRDLLNGITRDNDLSASIYCVGIGVDPDRALLEFLAYRNKGFCVFPFSQTRATAAIRDLMSRIRYPIIKTVRDDVAGIDNNQVFPRDLPDIHQGESFSIYGRFDQPGPFTMRLTGRNGGKLVDLTFTRDLNQAQRADRHLAHDWAFWKLHSLYSQVLSQGETPELRAAIEALRKEYGLKTVY